tara:strand:+ start:204 stop:419 length:216 start_codon:yes stop_codon:yes gene_type:complete
LGFAVSDTEYNAGMKPRKDETGTHSHQDNFQLSDERVDPDDYDLSLIQDGWGFDVDPEDEAYDDEEFDDYG